MKGSITGFINIMMELKKCCNHVWIVRSPDDKEAQEKDKLQVKEEGIISLHFDVPPSPLYSYSCTFRPSPYNPPPPLYSYSCTFRPSPYNPPPPLYSYSCTFRPSPCNPPPLYLYSYTFRSSPYNPPPPPPCTHTLVPSDPPPITLPPPPCTHTLVPSDPLPVTLPPPCTHTPVPSDPPPITLPPVLVLLYLQILPLYLEYFF